MKCSSNNNAINPYIFDARHPKPVKSSMQRGKAYLPIYGLATLRSSIQVERFHFFCEEKDDWYSQVNRLFVSSCLHL